ncbi:MAG TPA: hypothetical protein PK843_13025 [bacterium]|nr:hypothetical protein [bacterium]
MKISVFSPTAKWDPSTSRAVLGPENYHLKDGCDLRTAWTSRRRALFIGFLFYLN